MYKPNCFIQFFLFTILALQGNNLIAQSTDYNWKDLFYQSYYTGFKKLPPLRNYWLNLSNSKHIDDIEPLSYGMDAVLAMFETTDSIKYLDDAITFTNNVMDWAQVSKDIPGNVSPYKDSFKSWIEKPLGSEKGLYNQEGVLWEAYFFQYVSRLLKDIHNNESIFKIQNYKKFYIETLNFVEKDIWEKWESRGIKLHNKYAFLFLSRTHMACHWAYIAAELSFLTNSQENKSDYLAFVNLYNSKLEDNFYKYDKYISWHSTWDFNLDNTINKNTPIIQDVSHANLVVSYIVEAYDLGLWKDSDAIQRIINTLKDKIWDPSDCLFKDNLDGTMFVSSHTSPTGSFQSDGFAKLTRFDKSLFSIYEKFMNCSRYLIYPWLQYGQLFANLALSERFILTTK